MGPERIIDISESAIGLEAVIVLDSTVLGPAAGGVRTARYPSRAAARADAKALARSMTLKCSLAGLDAGGGKAVIIEQGGWDRARVFRRFGEIVQGLGGEFRTAGDLGTTQADLEAMALACEYVHTQEQALGEAVAQGLASCVEVLCQTKGADLSASVLAIQGCGAIGSAVARKLGPRVQQLLLADIDKALAARIASECRARTIAPSDILSADVDLLSPCAVGGALHRENANEVRAWGVCGGANQSIADAETQTMLFERGVLVVPDIIASSGAVIDGIGETVMHLSIKERQALIEGLGLAAREVLSESSRLGVPTQVAAEALAMRRLQ
jgi:leucine dehydrogenase